MATPSERWTIGSLLQTASDYLREKGSESPRLDAELLLAESLGLERIELYTQHDRPLTQPEVKDFRRLVARRATHEPVAYILGRAHFRRLVLEVDSSVLIPRPETEELVEVALASLRKRPLWTARAKATEAVAEGGEVTPLIAEVGTGSGAIAFSLAQEADVRVLATDTSAEALQVAMRNSESLGLADQVELAEADLLLGVPDGSLHLVVSNPPYVSSGDLKGLAPDVHLFEPVAALDAGPDGLAVIRRLLPEAARALRPGGTLLLEVGDKQAAAVQELATEAGFVRVAVHEDLSGKERIVEAVLPGAWSLPLEGLGQEDTAALVGSLKEGAIVGLPTDTVYGVAAAWDSAAGVRTLFEAKGRPAEQPVAVLFASVDQIEETLPELEPSAAQVLRALLPGPYTFVVATEVSMVPQVGTGDSLGVRVPAHPRLRGLIAQLSIPLAATSANRTGEKDVARLSEVDPAVLAHCAAAFDGVAGSPDEAAGMASTVVDLRPLAEGKAPVVLREGKVPGAEVLALIAGLND